MSDSIKVSVPASVANIACGFDALGMAIDKPCDVIVLRKTDAPGIIIKNSLKDLELPLNPKKNTSGVSLISFLNSIDSDQGFEIEFLEKIKAGGGMGSSAASAVASVYAANELMGCPMTPEQLLPAALDGEQVASKAIHADNVGPALLGGIVLATNYSPIKITKILPPKDLYCVVVCPNMDLNTVDSRGVLPENVSLKKAVKQAANLAGLITGLINSDYDLISSCLVDVLIEPHRKGLIPQFDQVKSAALDNGALGCSISGGGPSVFALANDLGIARNVEKAMKVAFFEGGIESIGYASKVNSDGPKILD